MERSSRTAARRRSHDHRAVVPEALKALNGSKMRSFLTMLGIIIGVMSVCLLVSIVQGATDEVTGQFSSLGGNTLVVNVENAGNVKLTLSDLRQLATPQNGIAAVSPSISRVGVAKSSSKSMDDATVTGVPEQYAGIRNVKIEQARNILPSDMEYRSAVAIVGTGVADELFGQHNVAGSSFLLTRLVCTVAKAGWPFQGRSHKLPFILPLTGRPVYAFQRLVREAVMSSPDIAFSKSYHRSGETAWLS